MALTLKYLKRVSAPIPLTDVSMMTEEGKTTEWLGRAVKLRSKFLFETTQNAATATVIRALESIRAKTRVVGKLRGKKDMLLVARDITKFAAWRTVAGVNRRCVRLYRHDGKVYDGKQRVIWLVAKYQKGELYDVFSVRDMHFRDLNYIRDDSFYYVVAADIAIAREYAEIKREKTLRRFRGLARMSLGWLMHKVSGQGMDVKTTAQARKVYQAVNIARKNLTGNEDTGGIGIYVKDGLDYAVAAVDGGQAGVNDAIKSAVNGIVGQINRMFDNRSISGGWWKGKIACPFPEVKRSNKKG